ncbi:hypothetical protein ADICYQ_1382 [Cyclobacterium qasimii M12-11B]|uniref:Phospholipase D-like domain-containing protein n=3 Tax=Cyclobacterium qasimii TaxID=1350429 RepID=S7VJB5_9BACT|nr:hypothetical protein ADICYQ_1382 [Cyclobacterium qasimii M12-11B]
MGTIEISHAIENLIQESFRSLIFVSPYLKITERIKSKLSMHLPKIDNCYFVYRKNELKTNEEIWLKSFSNIHLVEVQNLHAKVYLNEKYCILTSMNFYEYSQINNFEIGVKINREDEKENYEEVIKQVMLMIKLSENNSSIQGDLEQYSDYSNGKLFNEISRITTKSSLKKYAPFCNAVRETVKIEKNELYEDGTAILRSTVLGKNRYMKAFNALK